jgi:chromosomal replication initiation ATPase DnaA
MIMTRPLQQPAHPLPAYTPEELWHLVLAELRQQMTKTTFNAWLVDSCILSTSSTSAFWVVVVRNEFAWEWLTYQLSPVVERTIVGLVGNAVTICFIPRTMRNINYEPFRRTSARISFDAAQDMPQPV